ncbi:hypothetical protein ACU8DI_11640 [Psychroserpens sp. BH13MA-6]
MKHIFLILTFVIGASQVSLSQDWLTSLEVAKRLALVQNKMIFMMWEDTAYAPYPVIIDDANGLSVVEDDLFKATYLNPLIWDHFVPVLVSESMYKDLYDDIKQGKSQAYLDKFNDDSIKIMDVNGNILNTNLIYDEVINLTELIRVYHLDTSYLKGELISYSSNKNFTSTYYLASKYTDMAIYINEKARAEMIRLAKLYLDEATMLLQNENSGQKAMLQQKIELLELQQLLILNNPRKVLRKLKRLDPATIDKRNETMVAFLYITAHRLLKDEESASAYRDKVSVAEFEKSNAILTIYK